MNQKTIKEKWPFLYKLGIKVYDKPWYHVKPKELKVILKKNKISLRLYDKYFGVQTMMIVDGKPALFPWDVNLALKRIIQNYEPSVWECD